MIVGVLGAGQLGRMLGLAGVAMGLEFRFFDQESDAPAAQVGRIVNASYDNRGALDAFGAGLDVVTFEFENVPSAALEQLSRTAPVHPAPAALKTTQDRLSEKRLFRALDIQTPLFFPVGNTDELETALAQTGYPAVLKTRRFGYDGKGQWMLHTPGDLRKALPTLPRETGALILEGYVPFDREVSIIAARGRGGDVCFYPLVENRHEGGILRLSMAPAAHVSPDLQRTAQDYATKVMETLDYVGVLAVELFQVGEVLLANEIAPRVHNSGHWTIEGAETSQFENHLRAVLGLPLGSTAALGLSAMWNVLGAPPRPEDVLSIPGAHLHLYGKEPRAGRKIGHITITAQDQPALDERLARVQRAAPQS